MLHIAHALLDIAHDPAVQSKLPDIIPHAAVCRKAMEEGDLSATESAVVNLYVQLHGAGSGYLSSERRLLNQKNGYSCLSGGLSPLFMAKSFIKPASVVADLGAGNGLQGLLLQRLYPHRKTLQIELSSEMISMGCTLQKALGIDDKLVEWINDDIANVSFEQADFVYLYRPSRPSGSGLSLYQDIARKLSEIDKPLVIFSVADCLAGFLDKQFSVSYTDGHLTCFSKG